MGFPSYWHTHMSVGHCDDAISGMVSSGCGAGVGVVVDSRHAGVGSCRERDV